MVWRAKGRVVLKDKLFSLEPIQVQELRGVKGLKRLGVEEGAGGES